MTFSVLEKDHSQDSLETEIKLAPTQADRFNEMLAQAGWTGHYDMLNSGTLRDTAIGPMLDTALLYTDENGDGYIYITYDLYLEDLEYCFTLEGGGVSYEQMHNLLARMIDTLQAEAPAETV